MALISAGVNDSGSTCLRRIRERVAPIDTAAWMCSRCLTGLHLAADQPGVDRPPHDHHGEERVAQPWPERGGDRHRQEDRRKGQRDVDEAHDDALDPAAEEPGDRAEDRPDGDRARR